MKAHTGFSRAVSETSENKIAEQDAKREQRREREKRTSKRARKYQVVFVKSNDWKSAK